MRARYIVLLGATCACASAPRTGAPPPQSAVAGEVEPGKAGGGSLAQIVALELRRAPAGELLPFLENVDPKVRARAALALARVADPAGAAALVRSLGDREAVVRLNAAFALGALDPELPLLAAQIVAGRKGGDAWVREAAQARADAERSLDARLHVDDRPAVRQVVYAALGRLAIGPGLHHIGAGLQEGGFEATHAALAYGVHAARRGDQAHRSEDLTRRLMELAASGDADLRFGATFALARHQVAEAEAVFADRLVNDADVRVRTWAARGLGHCQGAAEALYSGLKDQDWQVRVEVLRALQKRQERALPVELSPVEAAARGALDDLLVTKGPDKFSGAHVLFEALPLISSVDLLRGLYRKAVEGPQRGKRQPAWTYAAWRPVRCEIAIALAARSGDLAAVRSCDTEDSPAHLTRLREVRALAWIARLKPPRVAQLHPYLEDSDARVRAAAVEALRGADDGASRARLRLRLEAETDAACVEVLAEVIAGWTQDPALVDPIQDALARIAGAGDPALIGARVAMAQALVAHLDAAERPRAISRVEREPAPVRAAVARALGVRPSFGEAPPWSQLPAPETRPLSARIRTARGELVVKLLSQETPVTVANFARLARAGFYDGLVFHRVVPGFVIQGGDPRGDGRGGPGYVIPCEVTPRPYERGVVGMALAGHDTGGSQFFVTQSRQPHLDGGYTAFGVLQAGWDTLDSILPGDAILSVVIE